MAKKVQSFISCYNNKRIKPVLGEWGKTDTIDCTVTIETEDSDDEDNDRGPCERQVLEPYEDGCRSGESTQIF